MDAQTHLKRLGWQGKGLGRQQNGINKPLLVSNKQNVLGLGSKSLKEKQADQWWLRAFDSALKDFGTGVESSLGQASKLGISRGGLYGFFVRGEGLAGTWNESDTRSVRSETSSVERVVVRQIHSEIEMAPGVLASSKKRKRSGDEDTGEKPKKTKTKSEKSRDKKHGKEKAETKKVKKSPREEKRKLRKLEKQEKCRANAAAKIPTEEAVGSAIEPPISAADPSTHRNPDADADADADASTNADAEDPQTAKGKRSKTKATANSQVNPSTVLDRLRRKHPAFQPGDLDPALVSKANELPVERVQKFARRAQKKGKPLETMVRREINHWDNIAKRKSRKVERRKKKERVKAAKG